MKAPGWQGEEKVRVETVNDPEILNPHDAIVKITLTAICGPDLHLYDGYIHLYDGYIPPLCLGTY